MIEMHVKICNHKIMLKMALLEGDRELINYFKNH